MQKLNPRITIGIINWLLLLIFPLYSISQSPPERRNYLPNIVPVSPNVAMMQKFGNYKVNLFSGLPDISIPIYEINTGKLRVPITLSYHASGVRVTDEATWVGLGWNLSAGGAISRQIMSRPDEQMGYLFKGSYDIRTSGFQYTADLSYLNSVASTQIDVEPDIYSCSLPTVNGKFYYANRDTLQPVFIPYAPVKLQTSISNNNLFFNLKDESGIQYNLGTIKEYTVPGMGSSNAVSAWNLTSMVSNDKSDTIYFNYVTNDYTKANNDYYDVVTTTDMIHNASDVNDCGYSANCTSCLDIVNSSGGGQSTLVGSNALTEIKFPEGKVTFELSGSNRLDMANKSLQAVKIYELDAVTKNYALIKVVRFFYSYFNNGSEYRMKLDSLQIRDKTESVSETYSFSYNQSIAMPSKSSRARDYWGFYNGKANTSLIPQMSIPFYSSDGLTYVNKTIGSNITNGRDPDPAFNQVGILTKINFPTGGYSEFTYETNKYKDDQNGQVMFGGGLRVYQIKSYDPITGVSNYKTYKYGEGESGYGNIIIPLSLNYYFTEQYYHYSFDTQNNPPSRRIRNYISNPNVGLEPFDGNIVGYPEVTEYTGTESSNIGKSVYKYSFVPDMPNSFLYFHKPIFLSHHFERGLLIGQVDYKNNGTSYQKVKSVFNTYGAFPSNSAGAVSFVLFERNTFTQQGFACSFNQGDLSTPPYFYNSYSILTGDNHITSTIDTVFDQLDVSKYLITTSNYSYGNFSHLQITKKTTGNSKNEVLETVYKYPDDSLAVGLYAKMSTANIKNALIDEESFLTGTSLRKIHTQYNEVYPNKFYPAQITSKLKTNPADTEITFDSYDDQGNILQYTANDGVITSFIWDYLKSHPVAKVSGAKQTDIAYTSFESDGKGNWTFSGSSVLDLSAPMGIRSYTVGSNITRSGLTPTNTYIVSYWIKSGTISVNSTSGTAGRQANGWTYYEHKISNPASGLITVAGSGAVIDELKLYPIGTQMSTYSYDPLVGLISQSDNDSKITYFEYDGFNRLSLIRDQDRNILKKFSYSYTGQPNTDNISYNAAQSVTFKKNNCTSCLVGSSVVYSVPAKKYSAFTQAAADKLATDEIAAYGQSYANTYGSCNTAGAAPISGTNGISTTGFSIQFHNNCTGLNYNFTLAASASNISLSGVPEGNYTVTISASGGGSTQYTYRVNGITQHLAVGSITIDLVTTGNQVLITP